MSRTPECRYCGNTDPDFLVNGSDVGEPALYYCHPWCCNDEPCLCDTDFTCLARTHAADESRATKKPAPIEEPA